MAKDAILEVYTLLYNSKIHNTNAFGTAEERDTIRELVYCGAYERAVKMLRHIKGGRGGGKVKRNEAIKWLETLYKPSIIKVHLGSIYMLPDGTISTDLALEKFRAEHPECEQFYGDMRKDKIPCKKVYRLYVYNPETQVNTYKYVFIERR
jgi:hypothetical protein